MLNKAQLIGRLGQKEVRSIPNGNQVVSYSIATTSLSRTRKLVNGKRTPNGTVASVSTRLLSTSA